MSRSTGCARTKRGLIWSTMKAAIRLTFLMRRPSAIAKAICATLRQGCCSTLFLLSLLLFPFYTVFDDHHVTNSNPVKKVFCLLPFHFLCKRFVRRRRVLSLFWKISERALKSWFFCLVSRL